MKACLPLNSFFNYSIICLFALKTFGTMNSIAQHAVGFEMWIVLSFSFALTRTAAIKARCEVMIEEMEDFHVQGEAVVISFPFLEAIISRRNLLPDNSSTFQVLHSNQSNIKNQGHRVILKGRALWLLPSLPLDSGIYTYVFRSKMYCLTGNISVTIYAAGREDMNMMSYPITSQPYRDLTIRCPHLNHFNRMGNPLWYKGFQTGFPLSDARYITDRGDTLTIKNVSREDQGLYTCRLKVFFNNKQYNVSRTWKLRVLVPALSRLDAINTESTPKFTDVASSSPSTISPFIISPENGSVIESYHGSGLVVECKVFVGNQPFNNTNLTWLVNNRSVKHSYLSGRAFQTDRRVSDNQMEVQLVFTEVRDEDSGAELKCVTNSTSRKQEIFIKIKLKDSLNAYLIAAVTYSCFFLLVCVFLWLLCPKQWKHTKYILARQNSSFST